MGGKFLYDFATLRTTDFVPVLVCKVERIAGTNLFQVLHGWFLSLSKFGSAEAQSGGSVATELHELFEGQSLKYFVSVLRPANLRQRAVEQSLARDCFLVEQPAVISSTGFVINPDVLV